MTLNSLPILAVSLSLCPIVLAQTVFSSLFSFSGADSAFTPRGSLVASANGVLYGTTTYGGTSFQGWGTIFSVNTNTGAKTTLYNFTDGTDGGYPNTGLIQVGSTLYGANSYGSTAGLGTLFSLLP